jgi:hypothetical protein
MYVFTVKSRHESRAPVAHCNPSYSGSRDQVGVPSQPGEENSLQDRISEKAIIKKGWWSGSRCRL